MDGWLGLAVMSAALGLAPTAQAQVTQTYSYDGHGRLTAVSTTGQSGAQASTYVYDDADNRILRSQTGGTAYAARVPSTEGGAASASKVSDASLDPGPAVPDQRICTIVSSPAPALPLTGRSGVQAIREDDR